MTQIAPTPPLVLTFSATDPSGGAGLQADLLTLSSIGCHALTVVTGITVQDTVGVDAVMALEADWIDEQARAVLEDVMRAESQRSAGRGRWRTVVEVAMRAESQRSAGRG